MAEGLFDLDGAIDAALVGVNVSAPSASKFRPLDRVIGSHLGLAEGQVYTSTVSKAGNLRVRALQSARSQTAELLVGVVPGDDIGEIEATRRGMIDMVTDGTAPGMAIVQHDADGKWVLNWAVLATGPRHDEVAGRLGVARAEVVRVAGVDRTRAAGRRPSPEARPDLANREARDALVLDERVRRMVRLAIASRPAVMLVGPPGTGKSQLLGEVVDEVAENPGSYGMTVAHDVSVVTLDEGWTTRELVGGETVDDRGRLRFSPGHVLTAIADDRWLVLDEANRADLDRIFGGLLTWLSGQTVTVGRVSSHPNAGPVRLGWNDEPTSRVVGDDQLSADEPSGESVDFLAGSEWRLLGTYNALDAQRVFRFGLALGRRFAHVPIEAPSPEAFRTALAARLVGIPERHLPAVADVITSIYAAHRSLEGAIIGPAMFLGMPSYIAAGLSGATDIPLDELIAESYLSALGMWLARLDDDQLDRLAETLGAPGVLGPRQWTWVRDQLASLQ